jgi:hypothetical protein
MAITASAAGNTSARTHAGLAGALFDLTRDADSVEFKLSLETSRG